MLNVDAEKKLIVQKKVTSLDVIKEEDTLSLKSLTLTFYTPKDDLLSIYIYRDYISAVFLDELRIIKERIY